MIREYFMAVLFGCVVYVAAYATTWLLSSSIGGYPTYLLMAAVIFTTAIPAGLGWLVRQNLQPVELQNRDERGRKQPPTYR